MTFVVGSLFNAMEGNNYRMLWTMMQSMTLEELVKAGTAVGPHRLRELLLQFVRMSRVTVAASSPNVSPGVVIPELLAEAFGDRTFLSSTRDDALTTTVRMVLRAIHALRAAAPQFVIYRDITHTLPQANVCQAPLSDADYTASATRNGITMAAIKAVSQVESGGRSGFDEQFRVKILFEAHHFRKYTGMHFDLTHPHLSCVFAVAKKYFRGISTVDCTRQ